MKCVTEVKSRTTENMRFVYSLTLATPNTDTHIQARTMFIETLDRFHGEISHIYMGNGFIKASMGAYVMENASATTRLMPF